MNHADMNPITEDDIANFLVHTPDFFERHAELLAAVKLTSPHGRRAVSLQERQAEMLREKIRVLELRMMELMRHGTENEVLNERMHRWIKALLSTAQAQDIPRIITDELAHEFMVPQVAIKVWGVRAEFAQQAFATAVLESVKTMAAQLQQPYVGIRAHEDVLTWLPEPDTVQSLALIPLHDLSNRSSQAAAAPNEVAHQPSTVIGLLVLASPDAQRYHDGMGTAFLERLGELASAALTPLR